MIKGWVPLCGWSNRAFHGKDTSLNQPDSARQIEVKLSISHSYGSRICSMAIILIHLKICFWVLCLSLSKHFYPIFQKKKHSSQCLVFSNFVILIENISVLWDKPLRNRAWHECQEKPLINNEIMKVYLPHIWMFTSVFLLSWYFQAPRLRHTALWRHFQAPKLRNTIRWRHDPVSDVEWRHKAVWRSLGAWKRYAL